MTNQSKVRLRLDLTNDDNYKVMEEKRFEILEKTRDYLIIEVDRSQADYIINTYNALEEISE